MRIRERQSDFHTERPGTRPRTDKTSARGGALFERAAKEGGASKLRFTRLWTRPGVHPFDELEWESRTANITNERGDVAFEQTEVEIPKPWSQLATNIVVSKYFRGPLGTPQRERSVRQLIARVADTIGRWGREGGYFASEEDALAFHAELTHLLVQQKAAFNSPVWFNTGVDPKPQASACFINSVEDRMESILDLAKTEGMLFKFGSGTGSNLSTLRSSRESLGGGGTASGPVSFMKGYDAFAGVIKSGGRSRRAAKMVILNVDHPDILAFIRSKAEEEKKAWALIEAGYDPGFNVPGGAYDSVFFQNANHSVRVTDDFMRGVLEDREWSTRAVTTGETMDTYRSRELLREMAEAAWVCGDPGLQFDTTTNEWHTVPNSGRINASNPCSEFVFLDDTSCNLSSLNLMKFRRPDGEMDVAAFRHAVDVMVTAQEILVDNASYPTPAITAKSHEFRPLGLGFANLGAVLMARGLPYDSDEGRAYAAAVTALMNGEAYAQSARIAAGLGAFAGFAKNEHEMLHVMGKHREASLRIPENAVPEDLLAAARGAWDEALSQGEGYGYRNAQVTVLAPTGTIAFMMDCDTTGIEPDIALVKYKKLVGGGMLKLVNQTVPEALRRLGYTERQIKAIVAHVDREGTIEGAPGLKAHHMPVFDCAFKPDKGQRSIHYTGHIRMMAAVQPFLSGAISKTVNVPADTTVDEIEKIFVEGWQMGLKAIAIYRDGCKKTQPLSTSRGDKVAPKAAALEEGSARRPYRRRLPDERSSLTHKFSIAGHEGYITVGLYEEGAPGEIFVTMAKKGSVVSGLMDSFATAVSLALQYGVPLKVLVDKFSHTRFEPSGFTNNSEIPIAKSITDYIFRWLALRYLPADERPKNGHDPDETGLQSGENGSRTRRIGSRDIEEREHEVFSAQADAPPCHECGEIMVRNGACYLCRNCGATSGCS